MTSERPRARRLLIAASNLSDADAALVFVQSIFEWSPATPMGLLIETETAGLQTGAGHRVVSSTGTLVAVPSRETARRIAKSEARALEQRLATLAQTLSTDWTCQTTVGEFVRSACAAVSEGDILLLGQRPILRQPGNVLLLGAGETFSAGSRALADALARVTASAVSEIRLVGQELLAHVDRSHAAAVVVDFETGPLTSEADLRRLVAAARCPVAVLGARWIRQQNQDASAELPNNTDRKSR